MNRPDSGSPDQSANQDDAVWQDLVSRLEGPPGERDIREPGTVDSGAAHPGTPRAPLPDAVEDKPGRPATFRDFDPLGLAGTAPTELSAAERQAGMRGAGDGGLTDPAAVPGGPGPYGHGAAAPGPRDYGVEDDGGGFVPEEPPSLAGTDPLTMLAWLGALGAPIALLLATMFWRSAPLLAILGMVAAFLLAVVYLIMKLPQEKDENDDGARV